MLDEDLGVLVIGVALDDGPAALVDILPVVLSVTALYRDREAPDDDDFVANLDALVAQISLLITRIVVAPCSPR